MSQTRPPKGVVMDRREIGHGAAIRVIGCLVICLCFALSVSIPACTPTTDSDPERSEPNTRGERSAAQTPPAGGAFALFESGQVRPLAMSPDGKQLLAVNTPD